MTEHAKIVAAHGDAIRIVPLYATDGRMEVEAAAAVPPQLTYRGGPLLQNVEVFALFWGKSWNTTLKPLADQLEQFFGFVLTSALLDQLGEYSVPGQPIGHGKFIGSTVVTSPAPHATVTDTAIQHMLQSQIAHNAAIPKPGANILYFVYLPQGVRVTQGGSASCTGFCGYHNDIAGQIFYAAMPYPGCSGCTGGLSVTDALTSTSSHELCEAITDAIPGQGWYDDSNGEIGDICAWKTKKLGPWTVQLEWSNKAGACT